MRDLQRTLRKFEKLRKPKTRKRLRITRLRNKLKKLWETLSLANLYEMYESTSDKTLKRELEQKILEIATGDDDLLSIVGHGEGPLRRKAWEKLRSRIQNGHIIKSHAREILIEVIKHIPDLRKPAWKLLKTLDPTEGELKVILSLEFIYSVPGLAGEVEKLLRKRPKGKNLDKTIEKIQKLTKKIKDLKKGQE